MPIFIYSFRENEYYKESFPDLAESTFNSVMVSLIGAIICCTIFFPLIKMLVASKDDEKNEQAKQMQEAQGRARVLDNTKNICMKYRSELALQRQQMVYNDAYGHEVTKRWVEKGIQYFIDKFIVEGNFLLQNQLEKDNSLKHEIINIIDSIAKKTRLETNATKEKIENLSGIQFEQLCLESLKKRGWRVTSTKATGDQGVDLIAIKKDCKVALQCKRSSRTIGNKAVQEILSGMKFYNIPIGVVVSNSEYTLSAKSLANVSNVKLLNINELNKLDNFI